MQLVSNLYCAPFDRDTIQIRIIPKSVRLATAYPNHITHHKLIESNEYGNRTINHYSHRTVLFNVGLYPHASHMAQQNATAQGRSL